jgi:hypothetical protein
LSRPVAALDPLNVDKLEKKILEQPMRQVNDYRKRRRIEPTS